MKIFQKLKCVLLLLMIIIGNGAIAQVIQAEYFIDSDPGEGLGTVLVAQDGNLDNAMETVLKNGVTISQGMHAIGIRVKTATGWGPVFRTVVSVEDFTLPDIRITAAEYFWDTDPGQGGGNVLLAYDGNFNEAFETMLQSGVSLPTPGIHKLGIRVKNRANNWGPVFATVVSVENFTLPDIKVTAAEYFWDTDPGQGGGTALIAFDGNYNEAFETMLSNNVSLPAEGIHKLGIRVKNRANNWGPVFSTVISVESINVPNVRLTTAEYFWDNDPGQGSGTALLAFNSNFDQAFETVFKNGISLPLAGMHKLNIRVRNHNNHWGPVFSNVISIENNMIPRMVKIKAGEAFWDADPGIGAGVQMLAFDGNYNNAIEAVRQSLYTGSLSVGKHKLSVRVKDGANQWSPVFSSVVFVDACANPPVSTITAGGSTTFCAGDSLLLTASPGFSKYRWVIGATTMTDTSESIYVKESGFYKAVVFDNTGCPGVSAATQVTVIPLDNTLTPSGTVDICNGYNTTIAATSGYTGYQWSNGATTSSITVSTAGDFDVTITNSGCTRISDPVHVNVNPTPSAPVITAGGPVAFCQGDSVILTSSAAAYYHWNTGDTTQSIKVTSTGTYYVTITNSSGCSSVVANGTYVNVTQTIPAITASGPTNFCEGDSISLYAGSYTTYQWSTGETSPSIYVSQNGQYSVTVTSGTCVGVSNPTSITVYPPVAVTPVINQGDTTFCEGGSVLLTSSYATGNTWSTGATTQQITVSASGIYYVTQTNSFGCSSTSGSVNIQVIATLPVITYTGNTTLCEGDTLRLYAGNGFDSYLWSTGADTSFIDVSTPGNYSVDVTNGTCSGSSSGVVVSTVPNVAVPTVTVNGPTTICQGDTVTLTSSVADFYTWTNGAQTQSVNVVGTGNYNVTVSNTYGCSATSAPENVTVYPNVNVPVILVSGNTTFCSGDSVTLTSSEAEGNLWSNGDTAQSIVVSSFEGNYEVTTSNSYGCSETSAPVTITIVPVNPVITTTGLTTFCEGDSVSLATGSGFTDYYWSTGQTSSSVYVSTSGDYTVTLTNATCSRVSPPMTITVNSLPAIPVITANDSTTFCSGNNVILTSDPASSYLWSNGLTTQSVTVTNSGVFHVRVLNSNGCAALSEDMVITVLPSPAIPVTSPDGPTTFCSGDTLMLTASAADSYLWSTGDTTQSITVTNSDIVNVTVTSNNGCYRSSNDLTVTVHPNVSTPAIQVTGNTTFCEGDSIILTSSVVDDIYWSTGNSTQSIFVKTGGTYYVTAENIYGCSAVSNNMIVIVNPVPAVPLISHALPLEFCEGDSVVLVSDLASEYLWSNGDTTRQATVKQTGVFDVIVSNQFGCSAVSSSLIVTVNPEPAVPLISHALPLEFCEGDSVVLVSDLASEYLWSNGDTTRQIIVRQTGIFDVVVSNQYGCSNNSQSITVEEFIVPKPVITRYDQTLYSTTSPDYVSYQWYFNGDTLQADTGFSVHVVQNGAYWVEVYDANGCSKKSDPHETTGIDDLAASGNLITVFPNPFSEFTTFHVMTTDKISDVSFTLFDVLGKVVKAEPTLADNKFVLNRESLAKGLYYYQFNSKNKVIGFGKVVIN